MVHRRELTAPRGYIISLEETVEGIHEDSKKLLWYYQLSLFETLDNPLQLLGGAKAYP
jgi:hypothetical protein